MIAWLKRQWSWYTAFMRLDPDAVCVWAGRGYDYHDYPDDPVGTPDHFVTMTCKRCGREFTI